MSFRDRQDAGRVLAGDVVRCRDRSAGTPEAWVDPLVLALPRGGVPVGYEVARALKAPLDVLLVRKLGVPGQEELALGAIASGGVRTLNRSLIDRLGIEDRVIETIETREREILERREADYRKRAPRLPIAGRSLILVDDGLATGASMRAAVEALRESGARHLIVAVPVAPTDLGEELGSRVDRIICSERPEQLGAVGAWYEDFAPTSDEEVRAFLCRA